MTGEAVQKRLQEEKSDIEELLNKDYCYTKETLTNFLKEIEQVAAEASAPLYVALTYMSNSIGLIKYNKKKYCWEKLDGFETGRNEPSIVEFNTETLVSTLFKFKSNTETILNLSCYGSQDKELQEKLHAIDLRYPIGLEQMTLDENQNDLMHLALAHNNPRVVEAILTLEMNFNKLNSNGYSYFYIACMMGLTPIVKIFLESKKINANHYSKTNLTPVWIACANGHLEVIRLILSSPGFENIDAIGMGGHTPLLAACSENATKGKESLFLELLQHGASLSHRNSKEQTAFDLAMARQNETAINEILQWANEMQLAPLSIMSLETLYHLKHLEMDKRSSEITLYLESLAKQTILKLSHDDIHGLGTLLGFKKLNNGSCRGFSGAWMLAALAGDKGSFYQRLKFIASFDNNLAQLVRDIEQTQQKKPQDFDDKEVQLLNILVFYAVIEMFQNPDGNSDCFSNKKMSHLDIFELVKPLLLGQAQLVNFLDKDYCFSEATLLAYLQDLERILKQISYPLPILLHSFNHTVCMEYNRQIAQWEYVDANDFTRYFHEESYARMLNTKDLVKSLFQSFETTNYVVFNIGIFSTHNNEELKKRFKSFDQRYPLSEKQNQHDDSQYNLLHLACKSGDLPRVKASLKLYMKTKEGVSAINMVFHNKRNQQGASPFHIACQVGFVEIVKEMLNPQYKVNHKALTQTGETAFFIACGFGHLEIVQELLKPKYKTEVNQPQEGGATPFFVACYKGHLKVVKILVKPEHQIDINKGKPNGVNPLYIACQDGHLEIVKLILNSPRFENIDAPGISGHTALLVACLMPATIGKASLFLELLRHGANIEHKNKAGQTAFDLAFINNNETAMSELLQWAKEQKLSPLSIMSLKTFNELKSHEYLQEMNSNEINNHTQNPNQFFSSSSTSSINREAKEIKPSGAIIL